ncbi:hypothetical protein Taro_028226 [Colocasia esculenta]|uniref:Uncharacterized protein n=1 Tax=Colocasia esculenta TaxID=4460 RepID=A0A843VKF6_COLES|nr:hypothetical protein [Colocasia esculenta]
MMVSPPVGPRDVLSTTDISGDHYGPFVSGAVLSATAVLSSTVQKGSSRRCAMESYSTAPTLSRTNPLPCDVYLLISYYL